MITLTNEPGIGFYAHTLGVAVRITHISHSIREANEMCEANPGLSVLHMVEPQGDIPVIFLAKVDDLGTKINPPKL